MSAPSPFEIWRSAARHRARTGSHPPEAGEIRTLNSHIAGAPDQQHQATDLVHQSIDLIHSSSAQATEGSEQVASASQALIGRAHDLN